MNRNIFLNNKLYIFNTETSFGLKTFNSSVDEKYFYKTNLPDNVLSKTKYIKQYIL